MTDSASADPLEMKRFLDKRTQLRREFQDLASLTLRLRRDLEKISSPMGPDSVDHHLHALLVLLDQLTSETDAILDIMRRASDAWPEMNRTVARPFDAIWPAPTVGRGGNPTGVDDANYSPETSFEVSISLPDTGATAADMERVEAAVDALLLLLGADPTQFSAVG